MKYHTWNKVSPATYWEIKRNILIDDPDNKLYNIALNVLNSQDIYSNNIQKYTLRKTKSCPILYHKSINNISNNFSNNSSNNTIISCKTPQSLPDYLDIKVLEQIMPKYVRQYKKWL